jgi:RNA polymerase sigma factor (sigma-70 family)
VLSNQRTKLLAVLESHGARLYALLTRLTLDRDAAEDLLQDLFLKLDCSPGFPAAIDPAAYACRAAIHLAFDWRRNRPRATQSLNHDHVANLPSPMAALILREDFEKALQAMGRLPALYGECLVLHYVENEPYEIIASQVGKTPHQVRAVCHKALVALRSVLSESPI